MSFSMPAIVPHDTHVLWYHPVTHPPSLSLHNPTNAANSEHRHQHMQQRRPTGSSHASHGNRSSGQHAGASSAYRSQLAQITHDENAMAARKASIRRFGSTWLRPPGVRKTYAAMVEEQQERAEAAMAAERERRAEEERQAALSMEINAEMQAQGLNGPEPDALVPSDVIDADEDGMDMGRDLDDDVPEGEMLGLSGSDDDNDDGDDDDDDDDDDDEEEDEDEVEDGNFNESSGAHDAPHDLASGDQASYVGFASDEPPERDLDDDVPEAGSYEHTDTDEEFQTESEEGDEEEDEPTRSNPFQLAEARRQVRELQQMIREVSSPPGRRLAELSSPPGQMLSYSQARRRADEHSLLRQRAEAILRSSGRSSTLPSFERSDRRAAEQPPSFVTPENNARPVNIPVANAESRATRSQSRRQQDSASQASSRQGPSSVTARGAGRANVGAAAPFPNTPPRALFVVHQGMPGGRPNFGMLAGGMASSPGDVAGQGTPEIDPESSMLLNSSPTGARGGDTPTNLGGRRGQRRLF